MSSDSVHGQCFYRDHQQQLQRGKRRITVVERTVLSCEPCTTFTSYVRIGVWHEIRVMRGRGVFDDVSCQRVCVASNCAREGMEG